MAANITIGSLSLDATGKVLTGTLAGGTGTGYAITNATGLTPHLSGGNAYGFSITGQSIAGAVLTINLATPAGTGETFLLDITTSATITDSGANTPQGQTNVAVTNSSSVTVTTVLAASNVSKFELNGAYADSGSGLVRVDLGGWVDGSTTEPDALVEFVTDATEVAVLCFSGNTASFAIDGGALATPTGTTGGWSAKAATTSPLAAGKHLFQVNVQQYFYGVRLSGGTRTIYTVPTTKASIRNPSITPITVPATTPLNAWGSYGVPNSNGGVSTGPSYVGLTLECQINGTGVEVATVSHNSSRWSCSVDGGYEGALILAGDSTINNSNNYVQLAAGLAPGSHSIHAEFVAVGSGTTHKGIRVLNGTVLSSGSSIADTTLTVPSTTYLAVNDWLRIDTYGNRERRQITAISGSGPYTLTLNAALSKAHSAGATVTSYEAAAGTISTYQLKDLSAKRLVAMGDSNTQGYNIYGGAGTPDANGVYYNTYDPRTPGVFLAAQSLGIECANVGIQGTDTNNQAGRAADINTYGRSAFDYVTIFEGTNDINGNTTTTAQIQTNVQTQITAAAPNLRAGGRILLLPPGTPQGVTSAKGVNVAGIASVLQTLAASNPTTTVYAAGLWNGVNLTTYNAGTNPTGDIEGTLHFRPSGHTKIANNLMPLMSTTGYAMVLGAAFGLVGTPVTISLTRAGGSVWETGDAVTLSDGGAGGTFGSLTFTPGVSTVATITYTPASAGTKTITGTNSQGWTDAGSLSYVSSAVKKLALTGVG